MIPFAATFASYVALTGCEQIRTDLAYTGMPVRLLGHHSGMSLGFYGTSHHALEDIAMMRAIADLTVVCAADSNQLRASCAPRSITRVRCTSGSGRGRDPEVYAEVPADFEIGRAERLRDGDAATIITTGSEVWACLRAAERLAAEDVDVRVVDMHTISPLDIEEVLAAGRDTPAILTVEEHNRSGGLGSAVAETLMDHGVHPRFHRLAVPDEHVVIGPPAALYAHYQLDADGVELTLRGLARTHHQELR